MKVYGLHATGPLAYLSGPGQIHSGRLYRSRERAEAARPGFEVLCLPTPGSRSLKDLRVVTKTTVIEYELEDETVETCPGSL